MRKPDCLQQTSLTAVHVILLNETEKSFFGPLISDFHVMTRQSHVLPFQRTAYTRGPKRKRYIYMVCKTVNDPFLSSVGVLLHFTTPPFRIIFVHSCMRSPQTSSTKTFQITCFHQKKSNKLKKNFAYFA